MIELSLVLLAVLILAVIYIGFKIITLINKQDVDASSSFNARIAKNWADIHRFRNDNSVTIDKLAQAFELQDELMAELQLSVESRQAKKQRPESPFLKAV